MMRKITAVCFVLMLALAGCNLGMGVPGTPTPDPLNPTHIVETVIAQLTLNAPATPTLALATATLAASPTPEFSPTPSATATITLTPTPSVPIISASQNTNCRSGPGIVYPVIGYLLVGDTREVLARLPDSSWWVIQHPSRPGQVCWVWNQTTSVSGDAPGLPVATPPPTPTPTKTPTTTMTPTTTWTVTPSVTPGP